MSVRLLKTHVIDCDGCDEVYSDVVETPIGLTVKFARRDGWTQDQEQQRKNLNLPHERIPTMPSIEEYDQERAERQRRADAASLDELRSHVDSLVQENAHLRGEMAGLLGLSSDRKQILADIQEQLQQLKRNNGDLRQSLDELATRHGEALLVQDKLAKALGEQTCVICCYVIGSPWPLEDTTCQCVEARKALAMVKGRAK